MFCKLVCLSVIAYFSFIQLANAEAKRVLFQGQSKTLFDITIFIDEIHFNLIEKIDAFTEKKEVLKVQGVCQGGMEISYKGDEDFIFEEYWAYSDLNLLYEDARTTESSTYFWTVETEVIYKSGDRIAIRDFHPTWSDFYENPSQRQIDEIKSDSLYRCNHKNIIGIRDNRPRVHIKFRSGRTLVGQSFWDHSRVSIVEVEPKFVEY
jgi:hypothetical protein